MAKTQQTEEDAPLKSRPKDNRLQRRSNGINYHSGSKRPAPQPASGAAKRGDDSPISIGSSSSSSSSEATPLSLYKNGGRSGPLAEQERRRQQKELDDAGSNSSVSSESSGLGAIPPPHDTTRTPSQKSKRPPASISIAASSSSAAASSAAASSATASSVTASSSKQKIEKLTNEMLAAMQKRLGMKEDNSNSTQSKATLITETNKVIKNKTSLLKAAKKCDNELYLDFQRDVPNPRDTFNSRTGKPIIASAAVTAWSCIFELLQYKNNHLSRDIERDIRVFVGILEAVQRYCEAEMAETATKTSGKFGKSIKLSSEKKARGYLEDGGKKFNKACPKCGHDCCDKEPDFEEKKTFNKQLTKQFVKNKKHLKEYEDGIRPNPPLDSNGKPLSKISNPTYKKQLGNCHCGQKYHSLAYGGETCPVGCKVDGTQYSLGQCPVCKCPCRFIFDTLHYDDYVRHFELEKMSLSTTNDERAQANSYLDRGVTIAMESRDTVTRSLNAMNSEGVIDLASDEVTTLATTAAHNSQAHFFTHNPPPSSAQTFLQDVMTRADHPRGPAYSNVSGTNMRTYGGAVQGAAQQRARNTRLDGADSQTHFTTDSGQMMGRPVQQPMQGSFGFSKSQLDEAMKRSLNPSFNAAASHYSSGHSRDSHRRQSSLDTSNLSVDFNQHSNSTPTNADQFKTPEDEKSSPEHVKNCRTRLIEYSMSADCENFDDVIGASAALTQPYTQAMVNFAEHVDKKRKDKQMTTPNAMKYLSRAYAATKK